MHCNEPSKQTLSKRFSLGNSMGLHARPASMMAQTVSRFSSRVTIRAQSGGDGVSAASVLGILTLAAAPGSQLEFTAEGADAAEVLAALEKLFEDNFGEP